MRNQEILCSKYNTVYLNENCWACTHKNDLTKKDGLDCDYVKTMKPCGEDK